MEENNNINEINKKPLIYYKVRVPQTSLIYNYNKATDILDVFIEKVVRSTSDELYYGVYAYFEDNTDAIVGISIMDYTKRNRDFISKYLPFDINFDYINKSILN